MDRLLCIKALVLGLDGLSRIVRHLKEDRHWWTPTFPTIAGVALALLMLSVGRRYGGLSVGLFHQSLVGHSVPTLAFFWKLIMVVITLGFGMSGGIITPLFVIDAAFGSMAAGPLYVPLAAGAEFGMIAVTAAGVNAPVALIIMGMELFGSRFAPEYLIVAIPAFIIIGNHSVYPSQRVHLQKSPFVPIPVGQALEDAEETPLPFPWTRRRPKPSSNPPESGP